MDRHEWTLSEIMKPSEIINKDTVTPKMYNVNGAQS